MARTLHSTLAAVTAGIAAVLVATSAGAGGGRPAATVSCENGRTYAFVPAAVSDAGDVVTARLYTSPRHGVAVRLIPMGAGYRYAGRGIWLDGIRGQAVLNFGKSSAVACDVTPLVAW
jgi:hypothetical protein